MHNVIMAWDFGHGSNTVYCKRIGQVGLGAPLDLDRDKSREVPTVILYQDTVAAGNGSGSDNAAVRVPVDAVRIGYEARSGQGAIPYFKTRPDLWQATLAGRPKRALIYDFFRVMMQNIREYNPDFIKPKDKILLYVGCPSSASWLDNQQNQADFVQLIREATGVSTVMVIAESRAALLNAFAEHTEDKLSAAKGAIVFDLGSLTLDFTYMLFGKHLVERSCTLGASQIDRGMLQWILKTNGLNPGDIWDREIGKIELDLRWQKEEYFSEGIEKLHILETLVLDEDGNPIEMGLDSRGNMRYRKRALTYRVDDDFMNAVLTELQVNVDENGVDLGWYSWKEHLRRFLTSCKEILDTASPALPVKTVILTGGASRMPFVTELCKEVFKYKKILVEANPGQSVAKGLCIAAEADLRYLEASEQCWQEVSAFAAKEYQALLEHCADTLLNKLYNTTVQLFNHLAYLPEDYVLAMRELRERLSTVFTNCLSEEEIMRIVKPGYDYWLDQCEGAVVASVNKKTEMLFPDRVTSEHFKLSHAGSARLSKMKLDLSHAMLTDQFIGYLMSTILTTSLIFVGSVILGVIIGPVAGVVYKMLKDWVDEKANDESRTLNHKERQNLYKVITKNNGEAIKKALAEVARDKMIAELRQQLEKDNAAFNKQLKASVEDALQIITLRKFTPAI